MSAGPAFLAPSSASIWVHCAAAPGLVREVEELQGDTSAADEGTRAHKLIAQKLSNCSEIEQDRSKIDKEMEECVDYCCSLIPRDTPLQIEQRVDCQNVHPTDCWGTPDCWYADGVRVHVWDYKHGHASVDAFENWQCLCYAAGILRLRPGLTHCTIHVVAPRCYDGLGPHRSWTLSRAELEACISRLYLAAERATAPNPPATPGAHCKDCKARYACGACAEAAAWACHEATGHPQRTTTTRQAELEWLMLSQAQTLLENRLAGVEARLKSDTMNGRPTTFVTVRPTVGRQKWTVPPDHVIALGKLYKADLKKSATVTPKQAEKLGIPEEITSRITIRDTGSLVIKPIDKSSIYHLFKEYEK